MNEEPKARQSINLDELERQLREASRNEAFRKAVSEQNINPHIYNPAFFDEETGSNEDGTFQTGTNWLKGTLSSKEGIGSRVQASAEQREPDPEFRGPRLF